MFLKLTVDRGEKILLNPEHVVLTEANYRIRPDAARPGSMVRTPDGALITTTGGTRLSVRESMEDIAELLSVEDCVPVAEVPVAAERPTAAVAIGASAPQGEEPPAARSGARTTKK